MFSGLGVLLVLSNGSACGSPFPPRVPGMGFPLIGTTRSSYFLPAFPAFLRFPSTPVLPAADLFAPTHARRRRMAWAAYGFARSRIQGEMNTMTSQVPGTAIVSVRALADSDGTKSSA